MIETEMIVKALQNKFRSMTQDEKVQYLDKMGFRYAKKSLLLESLEKSFGQLKSERGAINKGQIFKMGIRKRSVNSTVDKKIVREKEGQEQVIGNVVITKRG